LVMIGLSSEKKPPDSHTDEKRARESGRRSVGQRVDRTMVCSTALRKDVAKAKTVSNMGGQAVSGTSIKDVD